MNLLAYGEKRWSLYPPRRARYSKTAAHERWRPGAGHDPSRGEASSPSALGSSPGDIGGDVGGDRGRRSADTEETERESLPGALTCTQFGGDVLFVPTRWGHATTNARQSIGVAFLFALVAVVAPKDPPI